MRPPDDLRHRIAGDLKPVRPLLPPWQRALLVLPAAALAWVVAPGLLGLRTDIAAIGPWLSWGGSLAQLAVAVLLIGAALRESVPAHAPSRSTAVLLIAIGACMTVVLALGTHYISPEAVARRETVYAWWFCWEGAVLTGAPLLLLLAVLLARGLAMRPGLAGALAGMGAGSSVDGGWRLYCNYSNPSHVVGSHGGAVLALTLVGVVLSVTIARRRRKNIHDS